MLAIERFMQKYYRVVMSIAELSDLVGQHFAEVILWEGESGPIVPLNSRFRYATAIWSQQPGDLQAHAVRDPGNLRAARPASGYPVAYAPTPSACCATIAT